ncbi:transient receptor potential channel-like [Penaeus japonicus]|uniref:transient receptor potential channel-like n=1 Tax=Penaeus japonicus TaxID=27405 RepID=UPI001C71695F|nr:transient receptor potential channel-like [Penaeus japonicus]
MYLWMNGTKTKGKVDSKWTSLDYQKQFKRKECVRYVSVPDNPGVCHCGLRERQHVNPLSGLHPVHSRRFSVWEPFAILDLHYLKVPTQGPHDAWHHKEDVREFPTDAYGSLFFRQDPKGFFKVAHYIRISNDTQIWRSFNEPPSEDSHNPEVLQLFVHVWNLLEPEPPRLAISFTGDEKNFSLEGTKKKTFMAGLMKAVESTNAWLLTDGSDSGLAKVVGQTVCQMQTITEVDGRQMPQIKCIGIASYSSCKNKDSMLNTNVKNRNKRHFYESPTCAQDGDLVLNSDHTHFLLVDDGLHSPSFASVDSFRTRLEEALHVTSPRGLEVPVIMLLLDGGVRAIDRCLKALKRRVPVVVVQGSGGAADLLADAVVSNFSLRRICEEEEEILHNILSKVSVYLHDLDVKQRMECAKKVLECCKTESKITVYNIDTDSTLDKSILTALRTGKANPEDELRLALEWDRVDVAESCLNPQIDNLSEVMRLALLEEKVDFVDLLLTWGFVLSSFLTVVELRNLYNLTKPKAHVRKLLGHANDDKAIRLNDVHKLLKEVVNSHSHRYYRDMNSLFEFCSTINKITFEDPYLELLIWAIITRRNNLAKYLWETCNFPLNTAIVATCIYQGIRDKVTDSAVRAECKAMKDHFETIAIKLSDLSYDKNVTNSVSLIHQRYMRWGGLSTLDLALVACDMSFISSPCARAGQDMRWKSIRIKFYVRISYRVLLMFAHFILVLFNLGYIPTYTEGILALIIASEALEKVVEMLSSEPFSASYSAWNSYDIVLLIVFLLGFFLRSLSFLN